jgi:hypothetical protein
MTKLVADESLRSKLMGLSEEIEICDEQGRTVGHFLPREAYLRLMYEPTEPQITKEEIERRLAEPGGRSLAEIWESLGRKR